MKEKFEPTKRKQLIIALTALAAGFVLIVIGSSLLSGDAQREKEQKLLELPQVKYIDSDRMERDSFKEIYGKELTAMQQKQKETDRQIQDLIKIIEEKNKKDVEKRNSESEEQKFSASSLMNNLDINIPPLENIQGNGNSENIEENNQSSIEVRVEENLLIMDDLNKEDVNNSLDFENKTKPKSKKISIPAGTFVKATLLNGLDAPASANAKQEPHPVILRITDNANLPNKYKSDIKECRAIASGYGELSSERAIIRIESLSCISKDGTKYESLSDAVGFVTGEDGKIGLLGRVVTKQGAILARTMIAGFAEGMAKVFEESSRTTNTSGIGVTSTIDPNKAGQSAIYGGIGEGAKKLSEYYLKLNDQMFPVVEINVGRDADIIFNKSVVLNEIIDKETEVQIDD